MTPIAYIHNAYEEKFGIPRQSGLVSLPSLIRMEKPYRKPEVFRGLDGFSHIWLLWEFSESIRDKWSPTVRPPRLGGNQRMGVFATRSPFRPNPIGLSVVQLLQIVWEGDEAPYLLISGADLMNGTPIYDIKPYLPHIDSIPTAKGGFAQAAASHRLAVVFPPELWERVPQALREGSQELLAQDPRPSYQNDPSRMYGFAFGGLEVRFTVEDHVLTVREIEDAIA